LINFVWPDTQQNIKTKDLKKYVLTKVPGIAGRTQSADPQKREWWDCHGLLGNYL
jgi:hypothetical protein